jgi:branched-chain amino acid transport system ATP-binding protein
VTGLIRRTGPAAGPAPAGPAALSVRDLSVDYDGVVALAPLSFELAAGETLAVLGANGAGKTTLANALSGLVAMRGGVIDLDGTPVAAMTPEARARLGIGHLPDFRAVFPNLTVTENLQVFFQSASRRAARSLAESALGRFPALRQRTRIPAGRLSGGEQQMLAFCRLLVRAPRVLIVDELSHGLAPGIVAELFKALNALKGSCTTIVIEQYVGNALAIADSVIVLSRGQVRHRGPAAGLSVDSVAEIYSLDA